MKTIWPEGLAGKELFRFLIANKTAIYDMKKSATKMADIVVGTPGKAVQATNKGYAYANDEKAGKLIRTIVMNTYNWLDSHDDVHQNNIFARSLSDRGDRIPHLHDHEFKIAAKVGLPIAWSEKQISWGTLGVDKFGNTMALLLESEIQKDLNKGIYKAYLADQIDQHSVGMQYVSLDLAVNDADYEEEYKIWQSTFDKLGNPEKAVEQGYYFAVNVAKLIEGSAVLIGSNELTPTLNNKFVPLKDIQPDAELVPLDIAKTVAGW